MLKEFVPKEGDLVRVQKPPEMRCFKRNYMLVVWPNPVDIPEAKCRAWGGGWHINYIKSPFIIDLFGSLNQIGTFGLDSNDKLVRPTVKDMFEILNFLTANGIIYNRKTKQLIRLNSNESNR